jgi:putative spermidine/putrescine transport system ATP-binding protein
VEVAGTLAVIGPSGAGKTTLLRLIAGLERPAGGAIECNGHRWLGDGVWVPPERRRVGFVFQDYALFPHMSVRANVAFEARIDVDELLERLRIGHLAGDRPGRLSGGERQRVALARALAIAPQVLLLDEPLAALDRKLREDMQLEFRRIQQQLGVTTINVTHDQREALVMSDEIMVMEAGRVEQMARPVETYQNPATRFVAGFIGVTNFLPGVVTGRDGADLARIRVGSRELSGRCPAGVALAEGRMVDCALRAEQIRLALSAEGLRELDAALPATVTEAFFEGDRIVYGVECPELGAAPLRIFDYDPLHRSPYSTGDHVHVGWNASDLMIFPR